MRRRTDRSAVAVLDEYLRFHECAAESAHRQSTTRVVLATGVASRSGDRAIVLERNLIGTHCGEGFFSPPSRSCFANGLPSLIAPQNLHIQPGRSRYAEEER